MYFLNFVSSRRDLPCHEPHFFLVSRIGPLVSESPKSNENDPNTTKTTYKPFPKQATDKGALVHVPEHLTSALCALGSDLRKQSAARVARAKEIQDAVADMAPFDKLSPEHKEAVHTVCHICEADREQFKRSSSQEDSMAMLHWIPPVVPFAEVACFFGQSSQVESSQV